MSEDSLEFGAQLMKMCNIITPKSEERPVILENAVQLLETLIQRENKFLRNFFGSADYKIVFNKVAEVSNILMFDYEDDEIQTFGSKIFAVCFGINFAELLGTYESFIAKMNDPKTSLFAKYSIISTLAEIVVVSNFNELVKDSKVTELIKAMFDLVLNIVKNPQSEEDDVFLRIQACRVITLYINTCGKQFIDQEKLCMIINAIPASLSILNLDLNKECNEVIIACFKTFYSIITPLIRVIFNYTKEYMTKEYPDDQFNITALRLWVIITDAETEIKKNSIQRDTFLNVFQDVCDDLSNIFYGIILSIDPNDTDVEDPKNNPKPSMNASVALLNLFGLCPSNVLDFVSAKANELLSRDSWTALHTFCILIYTITAPLEFGQTTRSVFEFIRQYFKNVVMMMNSEVPRLRETSMWVVSKVINRFPNIISENEHPLEYMYEILSYLGPKDLPIDNNTHPTIVMRVISIIYNLCKCFRPTNYNNPLTPGAGFFETAFTLITNTLSLKQTNERPEIITQAHEVYNTILMHSPKDISVFKSIAEKFLSEIGDVCMDDTKPYRIAGYFSNISTIVCRIGEEGEDIYPQIINTVLQNLETGENKIYEEGLITLATIICRDYKYNEHEVSIIMNDIKYAIESNNPGVITSASILLTDIFKKFKDNMVSYYDDTVSLLNSLIISEDVFVNCKPPLIKTLSDIICSYNDEKQELAVKYKCDLYNVLVYYRDLPYPTSNNEELKLTNEFLASVAYGFRNYGYAFFLRDMDRVEEKNMLIDISKVSHAMVKVQNLSDEALRNALDMFEEYSHNCSRRNGITLNKGINYKIMDLAANSPNLSRRSREVRRILGNI